MTATPRQWAVFVDNVEPRIVMTAHQFPDGGHGSLLALDTERSIPNVTIWLGGDGEPAMIEAEGGHDMRQLEDQIGRVVHLSDRWVAGSPTLDCLRRTWIWWHDDLVVSRDAPSAGPTGPGPLTEARVASKRTRNAGRVVSGDDDADRRVPSRTL